MVAGARGSRPPSEGQPFLQRFMHWMTILDPSVLLASDGEIRNSRILLDSVGEPGKDSTRDRKVKEAWKLNLSSVHPDTGNIIPVFLRPPALMPMAAPLVVVTSLPHRSVRPALFCQFLFHLYSAGFNAANGNATSVGEDLPQKQTLLCLAAISYGACAGVIPQFLMKRYSLNTPALQTFFMKFLPVPLFTFLSAFNLLVVRAIEAERGIQVVDKHGSVIGVSKKAGVKAITETAVSRAALIGTTLLLPSLFLRVLQSGQVMRRNAFVLAPIRHLTTAFTFGVMIPVSFSLFPQTGTILRTDLEEEIQSSTEEAELFYNRGL